MCVCNGTDERIKEHSIDEWRLCRAQTIVEYTNEVGHVLELPVLNLLAFSCGVAMAPLICALWALRTCCPMTLDSRVRFPWESQLDLQPPPKPWWRRVLFPDLENFLTEFIEMENKQESRPCKCQETGQKTPKRDSRTTVVCCLTCATVWSSKLLHQRWIDETKDAASLTELGDLRQFVKVKLEKQRKALSKEFSRQLKVLQQHPPPLAPSPPPPLPK